MQVQHELQLIEPNPLKGEDFISNYTQPLDRYTLHQAGFNSIEHLAAYNTILATYSRGLNQITLIDTRNPTARRDRFSLKSCDKRYSRRSFVVNGMDFSPDGTRLAVGQSDCIIYIYKLMQQQQQQQQQQHEINQSSEQHPASFGKPVISGKFVCSSPVSCLAWCEVGILFGTRDGKVKLISLGSAKQSATSYDSPTNPAMAQAQTKVINIYNSPRATMPVALACKKPVIAVGFIDSSVQVLHIGALSEQEQSMGGGSDGQASRRSSSVHQLTNAPSAAPSSNLMIDHGYPAAKLVLMQTNQLCCASSDGRLAFYSLDILEQNRTASQIIALKEEIVSLDYSPTNDMLAIITRNRLMFVILNAETNKWQLQVSSIEFSSPTALSCVGWIKDGAQLVVGTRSGSLELFRCNWNKQSLNDQLDICHIAKNRVRITDRERNLLAMYKTSHDIKRVNLFDEGRSVLIWTTGSLLLARLGLAQSEIKCRRDKWASSKFYFHPSGYVVIFTPSTGELSLVKLGQDTVGFSAKLDSQTQISKSLVSLSCWPLPARSATSQHARLSPKRGSDAIYNLQANRLPADGDETPTDGGEGGHRGKIRGQLAEKLAYVATSGQSLHLVNLGMDANNDNKIIAKEKEAKFVWLDLCCTGKYLAWLNSQNRMTLLQFRANGEEGRDMAEIKLNGVSYCRWIPDTDILVAQSQHKIYIWYRIELMHNPKVIDSRGYNSLKRAPIIDLSYASSSTSKNVAEVSYPRICNLTSSEIRLSNSCSIPLDGLLIRFHREIIQLQLESALKLLEKETSPDERRISLWTQLGWASIKEEQIEIAMRAFGEINHASMVEYLKECSKSELDEMHWRLAKLNGDWDLFERLQDPDTVVSTYKRLNKWSKCIDYLGKTQQFRQRDLAERELRQWLIGRGRYLEAAKLQAQQTGDLRAAVQLLIDNKSLEEAAKLLLDESRSGTSGQLDQIPARLRDQLVTSGFFELAAKISNSILGDSIRALDLFLRCEHYDEALLLATSDEQRVQIKRQYAEKLINNFKQNKIPKRQATRSVELHLECGAPIEAILAAIELGEGERALELVELHRVSLDEQQVSSFCDKIASILLAAGDQDSLAIRAYHLGKQYSRVVALSIEAKRFDEAFRVSLKFIHNDDNASAREQFKQLAQRKIDEKDLDSAEKIYLIIGEIDTAIGMHLSRGNHQRMIQIVEEYQPESRERYLLLLAKQMEQEARYEEAEKYLLKAGEHEWTNVVRMYRLANKWDGAYRVAREHCQSAKDPLLVQLAYFWAKSQLTTTGSVDKTRELLIRELDCLREVLEFSCENNNFGFAIELCGQDLQEKREIVKKYAKYLEKSQEMTKAAEILVQNNLLKDAVRMYLDNDLHTEAIRVIEDVQQSSASDQQKQLVDLLNGTLIEAANRISSQIERSNQLSLTRGPQAGHESDNDDKLFALAQQMYLRAQKPELAIEMYKSRGLWQEAIQLAQRFAPQLLESVERDLDAQVSLDLKPILNGTSVAYNNKMSRSSSRSSSLATTVTLNGRDEEQHLSALNQSDAAEQFVQLQAEKLIRRGRDSKGSRQALGKFLGNLADGDPQNESSCLVLAERLAQFEKLQAFDPEIVGRIHSLAIQLFQMSCPLIGNSSQELLSVWQRVRDLVAKSLMGSADGGLGNEQLQEGEQILLALHYVILHRCLSDKVTTTMLQQQKQSAPILGPLEAGRFSSKLNTTSGKQLTSHVSLLSRLSMSLLRYSDLLDAKTCFLNAGFWSLVAGRASFSRFAWSRLIELVDSTDSSNRLERQLMQAGCPQTAQTSNNMISARYPSLGEIRSWLIESLLDNRASLELSPLEEDGQLESSLRGSKFRPCLVSGYPVYPDGGGQSIAWAVRLEDWTTLRMLESESDSAPNSRSLSSSKRTLKQIKLTDCVQFVNSLVESDSKTK